METNKLLGLVLLLTGAADLVMARMLGPKLGPQAALAIQVFGAGFIFVGSLLSLGVFKLV